MIGMFGYIFTGKRRINRGERFYCSKLNSVCIAGRQDVNKIKDIVMVDFNKLKRKGTD
jgi:hypothetical protein